MTRAGGSEQFWPHRVQWARETALMLADFNIVWFEEPLAPDDLGAEHAFHQDFLESE